MSQKLSEIKDDLNDASGLMTLGQAIKLAEGINHPSFKL